MCPSHTFPVPALPCPSQDVVELQLLREVASKSDSFFQAAGSLQHLLGMLGESMGSIRKLRKSLSEADEHMYSTAVSVKALQQRRSNLQATLDITKVGLSACIGAGVSTCCTRYAPLQ